MDEIVNGPEMLVTKSWDCEIAISVTLRDIKCAGNALAMIGQPYDHAQYIKLLLYFMDSVRSICRRWFWGPEEVFRAGDNFVVDGIEKEGAEMLATKFGQSEIVLSVTGRDIKCAGNNFQRAGAAASPAAPLPPPPPPPPPPPLAEEVAASAEASQSPVAVLNARPGGRGRRRRRRRHSRRLRRRLRLRCWRRRWLWRHHSRQWPPNWRAGGRRRRLRLRRRRVARPPHTHTTRRWVAAGRRPRREAPAQHRAGDGPAAVPAAGRRRPRRALTGGESAAGPVPPFPGLK